MGMEPPSHCLSSQHLFLMAGGGFDRIIEIRARKDLLGHLAQLSARRGGFSTEKTIALFSAKR